MEVEHFLIAGAQRCGTTFLYRLLDSHPEIQMARPERPEPKYFLRGDAGDRGLEVYSRLFPRALPGIRLRGEKSTSYMEVAEVPIRIHKLLPGARLVFVLRDPVERAISNYWFSVNNGAETLPIEEAFHREAERRDDFDRSRFSVSPYAYLHRGLYLEAIEAFERLFPTEQIHFVIFERMTSADSETSRLLRFLGVDPNALPPRPRGPANVSIKEGEVAPALRRWLEGFFAEPNRRLARRYGLDLGGWSSG